MSRLNRLLILTFIATASDILAGRAVYFYTSNLLGFTDRQNLLLAMLIGTALLIGALLSHWLAIRVGERRLLRLAISATLTVDLLIVGCAMLLRIEPPAWLIVVASCVRYTASGIKWPVIESFIGAGLTPRQTSRVLGWFCIVWGAAIPVALIFAGPLIASPFPWMIFAVAAAASSAILWLTNPLEKTPVHLPEDHPENLSAQDQPLYRALLVSGRWSMLTQTVVLSALVPVMPGIFQGLEIGVTWAAALSGVLDVTRLAAFVAMCRWSSWHGRALHNVWIALALPAGAMMVLLGRDSLWAVVAGQAIYGLAAGATYYAALYYALVVKRASVEAGGMHETLAAGGSMVGPAMGLSGEKLAAITRNPATGTLAGIAPFLIFFTAGSLWPLMKLRRPSAPAINPAPTAIPVTDELP